MVTTGGRMRNAQCFVLFFVSGTGGGGLRDAAVVD